MIGNHWGQTLEKYLLVTLCSVIFILSKLFRECASSALLEQIQRKTQSLNLLGLVVLCLVSEGTHIHRRIILEENFLS